MHFNEARKGTVAVLLQNDSLLERSVLIDDVFGKIRVAVWLAVNMLTECERLREELSNAAGPYWAGDLWVANGANEADQRVYDIAWNEAEEIAPKVRRSERRRNRGFWLAAPSEPAWPLEGEDSIPIVAFYSFRSEERRVGKECRSRWSPYH